MSKISAIILTKNEELMIADCIASVSFCDEVIVIDSGSTDRTTQIAHFLKAKVVNCIETSFAKMRDLGMRKAKGTWLIYIDADERVSKDLARSIQLVVESKTLPIAAYKLKRKNFYFGNHEWPAIEHMERLFKRKQLVGWEGSLHETAKVNGEIGELDGFILHFTHRDLTSMVKKTLEWSKIEAELRFNANHPKMTWWRFPRVMIGTFYNSYVNQKGWKVGTVGIIESMYQSFSVFITYARLWELQQMQEKSSSRSYEAVAGKTF